jgi:hypothetical protein
MIKGVEASRVPGASQGDEEAKGIAGGRVLRSILTALWLLIGRAS